RLDARRGRLGPRALQRRLRPLRAHPRRRQEAPSAPDQEPGRRERSGPHARGRRAAAGGRGRAERRDRGRARRLVDLGRRLRAAPRRARRVAHRRRARSRARARPRPRAHAARRRARRPPDVHRDARAAARRRRARPRQAVLGAGGMTSIRVGHLYPDYLNIYADRGNIAVLAQRAAWRGHSVDVTPIGMDDAIVPGAHDLYYVGGGQDREQLLVAENLTAKASPLTEAVVDGGAALLAVCGGYQLLGRGYRGFHGEHMPGVGLLPLETVAGERRLIGDVLIETEIGPIAGFENHAGRTRLDAGATPLGRVVYGFGNDGESGFEGCRVARAIG